MLPAHLQPEPASRIFQTRIGRLAFLIAFAVFLMQCSLLQRRATDPGLRSLSSLDRQDHLHKTGISASAGRGEIHGDVRYSIYRFEDQDLAEENRLNATRRIRSCYLQHGAGLSHQMVHTSTLHSNTFSRVYFGLYTIPQLLQHVCDEVIVGRQETVHTTILEMTRRTEVFLRDAVCQARQTDKKYEGRLCAYIGHSKGGAVAFNIARRCMQRTSLMRLQGCKQLVEIFSAAGVIQGATLGFLGYGNYIDKMQGQGTTLASVLGFGLNLVADFYVAYVPGITNPLWVDLSPIAPMEGGRPLYVVNDIALQKTGWLQADFAATGVDFKFNGDPDQGLYGCDDAQFNNSNYTSCKRFGEALGEIHASHFKPTFLKGLDQIRKDPRFHDPRTGNSNYLNNLTWQDMQTGDGLADYKLSLSSCFKGLKIKGARRAVKRCIVYKDLNHLANAGGNRQALADLIQQLLD